MESLVELSNEQFRAARDLVYAATGIRVADGKRALLGNRLRRRMRAMGLADLGAYLALLKSPAGNDELLDFIDAVTTNETFFFRNPEQYEWLRNEFLREITLAAIRGQREKSLRIWAAACSTGEEPYSIAICLLENRLKLTGWDLKIVATDISLDALGKARGGLYGERAVQLIPPRQLRRYFAKQAGSQTWQVEPAVRELVRFERHNLLHPLCEAAFDCIFLKNVMIYFDADSKRAVVRHLIHRLAPGGYLVIGLSEGVFDILEPLEKCRPWLFRKRPE